MIMMYGIPNCNTVKRARTWLGERGVAFAFHDFKKAGVERAQVERWVDAAGWETVLNRAGTTFRKLADEDKVGLDRERAVAVMLAHPSAIKRPVVEHAGGVEIGFKPERYEAIFSSPRP